MTAQPSPNGYRSFPTEFFTVLERTEKLGPEDTYDIGPFHRKADAMAGRRAFYRFRNALNEEAEKGDRFAVDQSNTVNLLMLEVLERAIAPAPTPNLLALGSGYHADRENEWYIRIRISPFIAAIRRKEAEERA